MNLKHFILNYEILSKHCSALHDSFNSLDSNKLHYNFQALKYARVLKYCRVLNIELDSVGKVSNMTNATLYLTEILITCYIFYSVFTGTQQIMKIIF